MVEGGGKLLQSFIASNLWDEMRVEICTRKSAALRDLSEEEKVLAPIIANAEVCEEHCVDGNKLLILLNSRHI
jgi:hypothetical protein